MEGFFTPEKMLIPGIIVATACVAWTLEYRFPYQPKQRIFTRKAFWTDFLWYSIGFSLIMGWVINAAILAPIDQATGWSARQTISAWPVWGQCLFFLVSHDLFIYCFHWLMHQNKYLWRIHELHHSPEEIDWPAGSRSHILETIIIQTVEFGPMIWLGAYLPIVLPFKALTGALWGTYIHSNINLNAGPLNYIINGPQMHRWHHSAVIGDQMRNLGTKFAIWDWIFGTGHLPKGRKPVYGLDVQFSQSNIFLHQLLAFRPWQGDKERDITPEATEQA
jgi:sterol desaturase/sphingolipid hydroxylase (fatty acid hydroxylase superfamily)